MTLSKEMKKKKTLPRTIEDACDKDATGNKDAGGGDADADGNCDDGGTTRTTKAQERQGTRRSPQRHTGPDYPLSKTSFKYEEAPSTDHHR